MKCEEIMKTNVQYVVSGQTVQEAARRMREHGIGCLPVCSPSGEVLGTLTDRDIAIRVAATALPADSCPVDDVLTKEVIACRPDDDLETCQRLMAQFKKSRILVTDGNRRLKGVISLSDIAEHERGDRAAATLREVAEREVHA
jgi:CBS domain-containing protein